MIQYYRIADLVVQMDSYGRTIEQAKQYRIDSCENVDITINSPWGSRRNDFPMLSDEDGEYLATGWDFYKKLLDHDGLMLHASAVVLDGRAYLFSADSGTGKSTHTQLWLKHFGSKAFVLNDDKPALRLYNGKWYAYGTPWSGKCDISRNVGVPVAGVAMLCRGDENEIHRWYGAEAIAAVYKQINRPKDLFSRNKLLSLLDKLLCQVPVWKFMCNTDPNSVMVSYTAMRE